MRHAAGAILLFRYAIPYRARTDRNVAFVQEQGGYRIVEDRGGDAGQLFDFNSL